MKKLLLLTLFLFGLKSYAQFQGVQTYLQVYNPTQCTYTVQQGSYFGLNDTTHRYLTIIPQSTPNLFMVWAPFGDSTSIIDNLCFTMNSPCICPASCIINYPMNYVDTMILFLCDTTFISVENVIKPTKKVVRILDVMGKDSKPEPNKVFIYLYSDGTVERKVIIKE